MIDAQLDLFGHRHQRLELARRAVAEGRTAEAHGELVGLRRCYPDDPAIATELEATRTLMHRLEEVDNMPADERPRALLDLARGAAAGLRARLLRRAADELQQTAGPCAQLDGKPASALLVEAGDLHAAWAAAAAAVSESARGRFVGYLADVEHRLGQGSRARARYRQVLVDDPFDLDWDALADEHVKALPDIARSELELDDGIAWAAPVGVVLKLLPLGELPPPVALCDGVPQSPPHALEQARQFLRALAWATHDRAHAIEARRKMKALAPQLLAVYLGRDRAAL